MIETSWWLIRIADWYSHLSVTVVISVPLLSLDSFWLFRFPSLVSFPHEISMFLNLLLYLIATLLPIIRCCLCTSTTQGRNDGED